MGSTGGAGICHSYTPDGRYADRISLNIELPTQQGLAKLAPKKNLARTQDAMAYIGGKIEERHAEMRKPDAPKPPPANIKTASREILLRRPGLGVRNVERILGAWRYTRLRLADLLRLRVSMKKVLPFIIAGDHTPMRLGLDDDALRAHFLPSPRQAELNFGAPPPLAGDVDSVRSGQL